METSKIEEMKEDVTIEIRQAWPDLLALFPVGRYIALLDTQTSCGNYNKLPPAVLDHARRLSEHASPDWLEKYHQLVLLTLISQFPLRHVDKKIPATIIELFNVEFNRIMAEMGTTRKGHYLVACDYFLKDLAISRLKLYPCGPILLDEFSGIPKRIFFKPDLHRLWRLTWFFLIRLHGFRPCYEMHMHAPLRKNFDLEGWIDCNLKIAELLKMNPKIRGVFCGSWWYDPQLEKISPRLSYLRTLPARNGALLFHLTQDTSAATGSIEHSGTRRRLFNAGRYIPEIYMMAWPRDDLIAWADRQLAMAS